MQLGEQQGTLWTLEVWEFLDYQLHHNASLQRQSVIESLLPMLITLQRCSHALNCG